MADHGCPSARCRGSPSWPSWSGRRPCPAAGSTSRRWPPPGRLRGRRRVRGHHRRRPTAGDPDRRRWPAPSAGSTRSTTANMPSTGAAVDHVCPVEDQPGCAALDDSGAKRIDLTSTPRSIIGSPTDDQAVVVGLGRVRRRPDRPVVAARQRRGDARTDARRRRPPRRPRRRPTEAATPTPVVTAAPADAASGEPTPPASETASASDRAIRTTPTTATPETAPRPRPRPRADARGDADTDGHRDAAGHRQGDRDRHGRHASSDSPPRSRPTASASRSRPSPADGSSGPDIYVWHTGDDTARRLTDDGRSVFASWSDDRVVGSRHRGELARRAPRASSRDPRSRQGHRRSHRAVAAGRRPDRPLRGRVVRCRRRRRRGHAADPR